MALFTIQRYMGDDEDVVEDQKKSAINILEKIKSEAKARKSIKEKKLHTEIITTEKTEKKKKRKKKSKDTSDEDAEDTQDIDSYVSAEQRDDKEKKSAERLGLSEIEKKGELKHAVLYEEPESEPPKKKKKVKSVEIQSPIVNKDNKDDSDSTESPVKTKKRKKEKGINDNVLLNTPGSDGSFMTEKPVLSVSDTEAFIGDRIGKENEDLSEPEDDWMGEQINDTIDDEDKNLDGTNEIGGFTVIGEVKSKTPQKLPDWLANPSIITVDLKHQTQSVGDMKGLDTDIIEKLKENGVTHFFPVQRQVIPAILDITQNGFQVGKGGYRPSDMCISAPTGSGKTLAFVLPIIQSLRSRVPVRLNGYQSLVDIIVATPGRLVDHINKTEGFDLSQLRFLVIDEADRMMEEIKQDWLTHLQKLLFSATLSQNPEKLQMLNLFQPKLFTSVVKDDRGKVYTQNTEQVTGEEKLQNKNKNTPDTQTGEFVGKYTTPEGLTEYQIECTSAEKPLILLHLLHNMKFRHVLCFTNSVESTHRLFHLIKSIGDIEVREFSSRLHAARRSKIVQQFTNGKIDILICSDAMARGMDVDNVRYVISYDVPAYIKTYIHRIGRTARAGKAGTAITLLQNKEFFHFKKMTKEAGKPRIKELKIDREDLNPIIPAFEEALKELPQILKGEKIKRKSNG
ncbi:hypothetical protein KUTeg_023058 [Tegillarca granosa]|uniref:ATP-dependent RNA helicase n=1 Tax=Tegillarca granosa TaxID=220873 RepID=A0ABQ9E0L4_TEGGR|nr:hypothetical protein KUTeg_023058 [Tegillarca granosa]